MIHAMYLIYIICTNTIDVLTHTTDKNLYTTSIARSAWYKQPAFGGMKWDLSISKQQISRSWTTPAKSEDGKSPNKATASDRRNVKFGS